MYNSEEEFLKNYDSSKFEKLSITSDIIIFSVSDGYQDNYRKLNNKYFSILLIKRDDYPFKDSWCLPGGFIKIDETTEEAAKRILLKETNLHFQLMMFLIDYVPFLLQKFLNLFSFFL